MTSFEYVFVGRDTCEGVTVSTEIYAEHAP